MTRIAAVAALLLALAAPVFGQVQVNVNGLYQLPWGLEVAANLYGKQGTPLPPVVSASLGLDGSHNVLVLSDVDARRLDDVWNLDLRLARDIRLARGTSAWSPICSTCLLPTASVRTQTPPPGGRGRDRCRMPRRRRG